jgi:acetyltransferase
MIGPYPTELIDVVRLGSGERVLIRPVLPQDGPTMAAFFGGLSAGARYNRFMGLMGELPAELIHRFTHIDYRDHVALLAAIFVGKRELAIAEARYVRKAVGTEAEFAVSVAEAWQGQGLARRMVGKLACHAASSGVERLLGETLATNNRLLHFARRAGFHTRAGELRGVQLLEKLLTPMRGISCADAALAAA